MLDVHLPVRVAQRTVRSIDVGPLRIHERRARGLEHGFEFLDDGLGLLVPERVGVPADLLQGCATGIDRDTLRAR